MSTGLIMINGNRDTGKEHIWQRHSLTSRMPKWITGKLENQSKFSLNLALINYLSIAEQVHKPENQNNAKGIFRYRISILKSGKYYIVVPCSNTILSR